MKKTMKRSLFLFVAAVLSAGVTCADTITSVQDGPWGNSVTWDSDVPDAGNGDLAIVLHEVGVHSINDDAADVQVSTGGSLTVHSGATLTVTNTVLVGDTGDESSIHLPYSTSTLLADTIRIGAAGVGVIHVNNGTLTTTGGLFVGADGFSGTLSPSQNNPVFSIGNGLTFGSDGTLTLSGWDPTIPPIDVVIGDVVLSPGWTIDLGESDLDPSFIVGDTWDLITFTGSLTASAPTVIAALGYEYVLNTATTGVVKLELTRIPLTHTWTNAGSGDWFDTANWDTGSVPSLGDKAIINNAGTSQITTGSAEVGQIETGLFGGEGHLEVSNATLTSTGSVNIGAPDGEEVDGLDADDITASFTATNATLVFGGTFNQGDPGIGFLGGTATISTTFDMMGGSLSTEGDYDLGGGGNPVSTAAITVSSSATILNASLVQIGDDLHLTSGTNFSSNPIDVTVDLLVEDTTELRVIEDFDCAEMDNAGAGASVGETTATFRNTFLNVYGESDHAIVSAGDTGIVDNIAVVELENCSWRVTEEIEAGGLRSGGGNTGNVADATIKLTDTDVVTGGLTMGERLDSTPGTIRGRLEMTRSFLETDPALLDFEGVLMAEYGKLDLGPDSELLFVIDGTTRATAVTVGDPGIYSAIDIHPNADPASAADLDGSIEVRFDFVPTAGTHTFELIRNEGGIPFNGDFDTYTVTGLDPGFAVDVFGVETTPGIVRLTISKTLFADGFELGDTTAWSSSVP